MPRAHTVAVAALLLLGACSGSSTPAADRPLDLAPPGELPSSPPADLPRERATACSPSPCGANQQCVETDGPARCVCSPGHHFEGTSCVVDIDPWAQDPRLGIYSPVFATFMNSPIPGIRTLVANGTAAEITEAHDLGFRVACVTGDSYAGAPPQAEVAARYTALAQTGCDAIIIDEDAWNLYYLHKTEYPTYQAAVTKALEIVGWARAAAKAANPKVEVGIVEPFRELLQLFLDGKGASVADFVAGEHYGGTHPGDVRLADLLGYQKTYGVKVQQWVSGVAEGTLYAGKVDLTIYANVNDEWKCCGGAYLASLQAAQAAVYTAKFVGRVATAAGDPAPTCRYLPYLAATCATPCASCVTAAALTVRCNAARSTWSCNECGAYYSGHHAYAPTEKVTCAATGAPPGYRFASWVWSGQSSQKSSNGACGGDGSVCTFTPQLDATMNHLWFLVAPVQ